MKIKILDIQKIIKPAWSHNPGFGLSPYTGKFKKQKILEQATIPEDPSLLQKLKIAKKDKILAIAAYYASWASKLKELGAQVTYSDISKNMVSYAKKKVKTKFYEYIQSNYEFIPKKINEYDWTFTFEACGGEQGLPIAYLRSLLNNKGGILVYFHRKGKKKIATGIKGKAYPLIVKTLAKAYQTKSLTKGVYFKGHIKGEPLTNVPHMVFWIFTNKEAQQKAFLDLKVIDLISKKRSFSLDKESKLLQVEKTDLKNSLKRISVLSKIIKSDFMKTLEAK